jgi:hypothetical protein
MTKQIVSPQQKLFGHNRVSLPQGANASYVTSSSTRGIFQVQSDLTGGILEGDGDEQEICGETDGGRAHAI